MNNGNRIGLQGWSIFILMIYASNRQWLVGGFAAVDMALVIAGYIITQEMMKKKYEHRHFLKIFLYKIIPSIAWPCIVVLTIGYPLFSKDAYKETLETVFWTIFINTNTYFYTTNIPYDGKTWVNPLWHLWAIVLIIQFYALYSLKLQSYKIMQMLKIGRNIVKHHHILIGLGISSWLYATYKTYDTGNTPEAFYLIHTRFWIFVVGGISATLPISQQKNIIHSVVAILAFLSIIITVMIASIETVHNINTLPIILATGILLYMGRIQGKKTLWERYFLESKSIQFLGTMTYGIYIIHGMLVSFLKYKNQEPSIFFLIGIAIMAIFLPWGYKKIGSFLKKKRA